MKIVLTAEGMPDGLSCVYRYFSYLRGSFGHFTLWRIIFRVYYMKSFLELVSEDMYGLFGGDFSDVTVVFPNKRSELFMNKYLVGMSGGKPLMTPRYVSVDDLFASYSELVVADPIYLVARLHEVYGELTGAEEPIDRFYAWGELLLSDFEDIDSNMVDASALFSNIEDLDGLTTLEYVSEEQRKAIAQFFGTVVGKDGTGSVQERWFSVWRYLYGVYSEFRRRLRAEGWAYGGMMKREVVERLETDEEAGREARRGKFCIVGFGALNETERRLLRHLQRRHTAFFYWDYDVAYLQKEAGLFVRENMRLFPNRMEGREWYDNMRAEGKRITFVASPTEDAGLRYVSRLPEKMRDVRTAVVLCNERGLGSVLHGLAAVEGLGEMNVTMGYPLSATPVYSFLAALTDLQARGRTRTGNWRYSVVAAVLRHPYARMLTGGGAAELLERLGREGTRFPTQGMLEEDPRNGVLFRVCEDVESCSQWLSEVVERLSEKGRKTFDVLAMEGVYVAYTVLNRLRPLVAGMKGATAEMFGRLLLSVMRGRSVPFHGEPAVGLQVMGLLETRNLDFENVLLLSAGEGYLPRIHTNNSFIPYSLRAAHGMTTIDRQNALYAYYFYRLVQRARNVTLVYSTQTEGTSRGEASRFLLQLQLEKEELLGDGAELHHVTLSAANTLLPIKGLETKGGGLAGERICRRFDTRYDAEYSAAHGGRLMVLSPSALNEFIGCPRRFYLHYVAGLSEADEPDETDVDDATFGTLLHYCMERLYRPFTGRQVQGAELRALADDEERIGGIVDEAFRRHVLGQGGGEPYTGHQLLNRHVLKEYVVRQLRYDALRTPFRLLGVETPVYALMDAGGHRVRIGGIIDRHELTADGRVRIVDYKTSTKPQTARDLESLFDPDCPNRAYHLLQALYYCHVVTETEERPTFPQLMYVKQAAASRADAAAIGKEEVSDFRAQLKDDYSRLLLQTVERIFAPDADFPPTSVTRNCEYCDFRALCTAGMP